MYLDIGFFQTLQTELGAKGGDFAEAYVVAHEYGHHIQNLYGILGRIKTRTRDRRRTRSGPSCRPTAWPAIWANHATTVPGQGRRTLISGLTEDDIARGLDAAAAVGDDRIQEKTQGQVNPESFSHGTAEQRMRWFKTGMDSGDMTACDTWSATRSEHCVRRTALYSADPAYRAVSWRRVRRLRPGGGSPGGARRPGRRSRPRRRAGRRAGRSAAYIWLGDVA